MAHFIVAKLWLFICRVTLKIVALLCLSVALLARWTRNLKPQSQWIVALLLGLWLYSA